MIQGRSLEESKIVLPRTHFVCFPSHYHTDSLGHVPSITALMADEISSCCFDSRVVIVNSPSLLSQSTVTAVVPERDHQSVPQFSC